MDKSSKPRKRFKKVWFMFILMMAKIFRLPSKWFSPYKKTILDNWNINMMWVFISSFGNRTYIDYPCSYKIRTDQPKTKVAEAYRLNPEEIMRFHEQGFLGPFTAISQEEMAVFREKIEKELDKKSKTYGFKTIRDRHLDAPFIMDLYKNPEIVERLAQLLGPDMLIWRSQVFNQMPGAPAFEWHQASTYYLENFAYSILDPVDKDELFQITVWIAVDEATYENGCLGFIPGTHDKIRTISLNGSGKIYSSSFKLNYKANKEKEVYMPLLPGQFVIFSERIIHGSPGNRTKNRRMGINFRAITPSTAVHRGRDKHYAQHLKKTWDLKNWGCVLLRGEDTHKVNKLIK